MMTRQRSRQASETSGRSSSGEPTTETGAVRTGSNSASRVARRCIKWSEAEIEALKIAVEERRRTYTHGKMWEYITADLSARFVPRTKAAVYKKYYQVMGTMASSGDREESATTLAAEPNNNGLNTINPNLNTNLNSNNNNINTNLTPNNLTSETTNNFSNINNNNNNQNNLETIAETNETDETEGTNTTFNNTNTNINNQLSAPQTELETQAQSLQPLTRTSTVEPPTDDPMGNEGLVVVDPRSEAETQLAPEPIVGRETEVIKEDARKYFLDCFGQSVHNFNRRPLAKPRTLDRANLVLCESLIKRYYKQGRRVDLGRLNALVYAAGMTYQHLTSKGDTQKVAKLERIERKAYARAKGLRRDIGHLTAELQRREHKVRPTHRQKNNLATLRRQYPELTDKFQMARTLEVLKQKLSNVKAQLAQLVAGREQRILRMRFQASPSAGNIAPNFLPNQGRKEGPCREQVEQYWRSILGEAKTVGVSAEEVKDWGEAMEAAYSNLPVGEEGFAPITPSEWCLAIRKANPWKAPGPDGIQGFWWKTWGTANSALRDWLNQALRAQQTPPSWLCRGRTVLLYKSGEPSQPQNYRPITCLPSAYKIITSTLAERLQAHLALGPALPLEQRCLKRGEWGCTHTHILDNAIVLDSTRGCGQKKLAVAWIDYAKAFDSIPHSTFLWCLRRVCVPKALIHLLSRFMAHWQTTFVWKNGSKMLRSANVRVRNGLLQGDSLSPLAFCLCISPISYALNKSIPRIRTAGANSGTALELNHQFYMDDLKIYARSTESLDSAIDKVQVVSRSIGLEINPRKCARAYFRLQPNAATSNDSSIPVLVGDEVYKYLGIAQLIHRCGAATLGGVQQRFLGVVDQIMSSRLSVGQKVKAYNTIAVPIMRYYYQNSSGGRTRFEAARHEAAVLDTRVRRKMVQHKMRYHCGSRDIVYLPRAEGGVGLKSLEETFLESALNVYAYLALGTGWGLEAALTVFSVLRRRGKRTPVSDMEYVCSGLGITPPVYDPVTGRVTLHGTEYESHSALSRTLITTLRSTRRSKHLFNFLALHRAGRVRKAEDLDWKASCLWVKSGRVGAIVERTARGVMEGNLLQTNGHRICRACRLAPETVQHIVNGCSHWALTLYMLRHNAVLRVIYNLLCKKFDLPLPESPTLPPVLENEKVKLVWDVPMLTRSQIYHNRPDMVVFDKQKRLITVIEGRVAWYTGITRQLREKTYRYTINSTQSRPPGRDSAEPGLRCYRNLVGELSTKYRQKVNFLPIVIGEAGEIEKSLNRRLRDFLGETSDPAAVIERMSRAAVYGTHRIVRTHLALEPVEAPAEAD